MAEAPGPVWPQDHAPLLTTWYMRSIFMTDKVPPSLLARFSPLSIPDKEEGPTLEKILNTGIAAFGGWGSYLHAHCVSAAFSWKLGEEMLFH